jgi:hypothetical protein
MKLVKHETARQREKQGEGDAAQEKEKVTDDVVAAA